MRGLMIFLGIGLTVFFLAGLTDPFASRWLAWIDLLAAIGIFLFAVKSPTLSRRERALSLAGIAGLLLVCFVVALIGGIIPWQTWWNFAMAVAVGLGAGAVLYEIDTDQLRPEGHLFRLHEHFPSSFPIGASHPYLWHGYPPFAPRESLRGKGPKGYRRSDERILEDVNDRLLEHWGIDATDIEVTVKEGMVTLDGTVDSRQAKRLAETIAETVSGVTDVVDNLRIRGMFHPESEKVA